MYLFQQRDCLKRWCGPCGTAAGPHVHLPPLASVSTAPLFAGLTQQHMSAVLYKCDL
jgi:hypothetical protein